MDTKSSKQDRLTLRRERAGVRMKDMTVVVVVVVVVLFCRRMMTRMRIKKQGIVSLDCMQSVYRLMITTHVLFSITLFHFHMIELLSRMKRKMKIFVTKDSGPLFLNGVKRIVCGENRFSLIDSIDCSGSACFFYSSASVPLLPSSSSLTSFCPSLHLTWSQFSLSPAVIICSKSIQASRS